VDDTLTANTIHITRHDETAIEAYQARPGHTERRGGVVVIHHLPGYDQPTKEITRRFAEMGYDAVMPNLYWREGAGVDPNDAAAAVRARGGQPDEQVVSDIADAIAHLRELDTSNGKVGVIGYCSGGRQTVLVACSLDVDAAVDCYGGAVTVPPPPAAKLAMTSLIDKLPDLRAPLLGLFGNDDQFPAPDHVDTLAEILDANGKAYEFHRYDGTGHGFFSVDKPAYRPASAVDGWERIETFFGAHLSADPS
jgi:carboxymethylenebutenolidase